LGRPEIVPVVGLPAVELPGVEWPVAGAALGLPVPEVLPAALELPATVVADAGDVADPLAVRS
jgi:hypothetical protein